MVRSWLHLILLLVSASAFASGTAVHLEHFDPDPRDLPSLQNGARVFFNYCAGCHSLKYQRYEKTADDLGIPHDVALESLIFTGQKIGGLMETSMPAASSAWFGAAPPDLTMVTRVRGSDWVYTYLKSFYLDESRPLGVNNVVFKNVGMPNVLQELQGVQRLGTYPRPKLNSDGAEQRDPLQSGKKILVPTAQVLELELNSGAMTPEDFDATTRDLVNFLTYVGEPSRLDRQRIGVYVILFLVVLYVFTFLLGREFSNHKH